MENKENSTWWEKPGNVRGVIASVLLAMFVGVLATFIVNPSALAPDKNQMIPLIIGVLIRELTNIITFYFSQKGEAVEVENQTDDIR